jgi:transcriptional regulator with XRE-family HTH domain
MESEDPKFRHIGLSTDGTVIFCEMDNGKTYSLPTVALSRAEDWEPDAKPVAAKIIHDGYGAVVEFGTGAQIDFPCDFVLHFCEPSYGWYKDKRRAKSGVGARIREIRESRGLTLDELAGKCGIAKPNLSRLENDKVTPALGTISRIAAALGTHPALLFASERPDDAWKWTLHTFIEWKHGLLWKETAESRPVVSIPPNELVRVFLDTRPEHRYARRKLLNYADSSGKNLAACALDSEKWDREVPMVDNQRRAAR